MEVLARAQIRCDYQRSNSSLDLEYLIPSVWLSITTASLTIVKPPEGLSTKKHLRDLYPGRANVNTLDVRTNIAMRERVA